MHGKRKQRHVFNHDPSILTSSPRKLIQPVEPIVELIKELVKDRESLMDYGAGPGYFTIPLARIFKIVYAVDMNQRMLDLLKERLVHERIENVKLILASDLPSIDVTVLFMANVLHELPDPMGFMEKASRHARYVVVIDWEKKPSPFGPPIEHRITSSEALEIIRRHYDAKIYNLYKYHYVIVGSRLSH